MSKEPTSTPWHESMNDKMMTRYGTIAEPNAHAGENFHVLSRTDFEQAITCVNALDGISDPAEFIRQVQAVVGAPNVGAMMTEVHKLRALMGV